MVDFTIGNGEGNLYTPTSNSRMTSVDGSSYDTPEYLQNGINKSRESLKKYRPEQKTEEVKETKPQAQKTDANCPQKKPTEAKPQTQTEKDKLKAAQEEKKALFKELRENKNIEPQEAISKLKGLKETFSALDDIFRTEIAKNQQEYDAYKPKNHTDIDGNNTRAQDEAFYNRINKSTLKLTANRSTINQEMRSINNKMLQYEMKFLRA
jgi:hypothetical protein